MTREIKFRAWDKETKEMSYDFLNKNWLLVCIKSPYVELMQFTGLKDKNGKKVYEGDIVVDKFHFKDGKISETIRKVEWDEVNPCFVLTNVHKNDDWEYDFVACGLRSLEVIGNIYENPELLESNTP